MVNADGSVTVRVTKDLYDRVKEEQDAEESFDDTLRYLLGWTDDEDDDDAEEGSEEE